MGMERCTVQHRVQAIPTVTIGGEWRWRRKGMGLLLTIISRHLLNITVVGKTWHRLPPNTTSMQGRVFMGKTLWPRHAGINLKIIGWSDQSRADLPLPRGSPYAAHLTSLQDIAFPPGWWWSTWFSITIGILIIILTVGHNCSSCMIKISQMFYWLVSERYHW